MATTSGTQGAKARLMGELKQLQNEKWCHVQLQNDSIFRWSVGLMVVNSESCFDGGYFQAEMTFTNDYPYMPPTFKFQRSIFHPNIYADGKLCISILHKPGEDAMSGETASERWSPLQCVESVLRSVLLLLEDPECSSPANVDAGVMYRHDRARYIEKAKAAVKESKKDIPEGFVLPTTLEEKPPQKIVEDDDFWNESDDGNDFNGSDSSGEDQDMEYDEDAEDGDQEFEDDNEEESKDEKKHQA